MTVDKMNPTAIRVIIVRNYAYQVYTSRAPMMSFTELKPCRER